ncbi:MAG: NUDIX domain-containing protein [Gammaproteobacteria bacterium]|jgi:predicted NUDIX family NTP pyrophosphohydrolase
MRQYSAGIMLYHYRDDELYVLLVHPGGPFWINKDIGAWSIPKGLFEHGEDLLDTARREFKEETGYDVNGDFIDLGKIKQPSGKVIHVWALEGDIDASRISSNTFALEWPPHTGQQQEFPEVDRGEWFNIQKARQMINKGQARFLDRLLAALAA